MRRLTDRETVRLTAAIGGRRSAVAVAQMLPLRREAARTYIRFFRVDQHWMASNADPSQIHWLVDDPSWAMNRDLLDELDAADRRRQLDFILLWAGAEQRDERLIASDERFRDAVQAAMHRCSISIHRHNLSDLVDTAPAMAETEIRSFLQRIYTAVPGGLPRAIEGYVSSYVREEPGVRASGEVGIERRLIDPHDALGFSLDVTTTTPKEN